MKPMNSTTIDRPRAWLAATLVAGALLLTACGGGSSTSSAQQLLRGRPGQQLNLLGQGRVRDPPGRERR
jgi:hypothetical protein